MGGLLLFGALLFVVFISTISILFLRDQWAGEARVAAQKQEAAERSQAEARMGDLTRRVSQEVPLEDKGSKIGAFFAAKDYVRTSLKAPSTADFGGLFFGETQNPNECVSDLGDGVFEVKIWVDAENSFGAKLRTNFVVTLHYDRHQNWSLVGGIR
jgi:hypothetical protein